MITVAVNPKFIALDENGNPLVGAKLYTYASGTTTPKTTWNDYTKVSPNTNPIILDVNGQADVWVDGLYRFKLVGTDDVILWTKDGVGSSSYSLLESFLNLDITANTLIYGSGVDAFSLTDFTAFARAMLASATAAEWRNLLMSLNRYFSEIVATATEDVADQYSVALSPTLTALVSGSLFFIKFPTANVGAPTLDIDGLGAVTIKLVGGGTLNAGSIIAGHNTILQYDGTNFILLNDYSIDSAAGVGSRRTIGTGSLQACAGDDARLRLRVAFYNTVGTHTWTRPSGVDYVKVTCLGSGGGGGGSSLAATGGGGGRGCEVVQICQVTGDVTVTVSAAGAGGTVGSAGADGGNGSNGGVSSFGSLCSGNGGGGGTGGTTAGVPGSGGTSGTSGGTGTLVNQIQLSGWGGLAGGAGTAGGNGGGEYTSIGQIFGALGRGGAGGSISAGGDPSAGAAGATGFVLVEW